MPSPDSAAAPAETAGPLLVIGGAEDKLGPKTILARFVELAGGADAVIAVVSTASSLGDEIHDVYDVLLRGLGAGEVGFLRPTTRKEADGPGCAELLDRATGVFLTGGNQALLTTIVAGTRLHRCLHDAHRRGAVIGGTSAGASALSAHMISFGTPGDVPKHRMASLVAGLGLLPGTIVDQHFGERNRIGRLLAAVASSPSELGIGVDEDTAAEVHPGGTLRVLGRGTIVVVDGHEAVSNAAEAKQHLPLLVSGVRLHVLPHGQRFSLPGRALLPPAPDADEEHRAAPGWPVGASIDKRLARRLAAEGAGSEVVGSARLRRD